MTEEESIKSTQPITYLGFFINSKLTLNGQITTVCKRSTLHKVIEINQAYYLEKQVQFKNVNLMNR